MRKIKFIMMLIVVVGLTIACDKSDEFGGEKATNAPGITDVEKEAMEKLVGLWTRHGEGRDDNGDLLVVDEYEFRFYEDGKGHKSIDSYDKNGKLMSISRSTFTYWIKDSLLYIEWTGKETVEWHYRFDGDNLLMHTDMDETGTEYKFIKTKDADNKFVGDWSTTKANSDGTYVVHHYKFQTPTYGYVYESVYKDANSAPTDTYPVYDFRYEFDDTKITLMRMDTGSYGTSSVKYYRLADKVLFLSDQKGGLETKYSQR